MGRKGGPSSKSKDKRQQRAFENERIIAIKSQLNALTTDVDILSPFSALCTYNKNNLNLQIKAHHASSLPSTTLEWAFNLTEQHMRPLYEKCPGWGGWKPAQKRKEMEHEEARYLIAYDTMPSSSVQSENQTNNNNNNNNNSNSNKNNTTTSNAMTPVAFVHVRFEEEQGQPICYLYEIQIASSHQGKGLGKYLMQLVELITRKGGLTRIMLTVFHENTAAIALYKKLGYVRDGDSPGVVDPTGEHGYEIMTKMMPPRKVL